MYGDQFTDSEGPSDVDTKKICEYTGVCENCKLLRTVVHQPFPHTKHKSFTRGKKYCRKCLNADFICEVPSGSDSPIHSGSRRLRNRAGLCGNCKLNKEEVYKLTQPGKFKTFVAGVKYCIPCMLKDAKKVWRCPCGREPTYEYYRLNLSWPGKNAYQLEFICEVCDELREE